MKKLFLGLGLGLAAIAATPAQAASIPDTCSTSGAAVQSADLLDGNISRQLTSLRKFNEFGELRDNLSGVKHLLAAATCTASCNADGSGSYSQEAGCTYTQSCKGSGGSPKANQA